MPACDSNFGDVVLLLNMDGADGSTSFPDLSGYSNNATAQNAAAITDSQARFGSGSLLTGFSSSSSNYGNCLTVPYSSSIDLSLCGPWTVEGWFQYTSTSGIGLQLFDTVPFISGASIPGIGIEVVPLGGTTIDIIVTLTLNPVESEYAFSSSGTTTAAPNVWHHFAFVFDGSSSFNVYIDGSAVTFGVQTGLRPLLPWSPTVTAVTIGDGNNNNVSNYYIDEVRVSAGIQRYTSNFTPPTSPFPTIACGTSFGVTPVCLFDEGIGGAYFGGQLNLVEFVYMPTREPFLEGAANLIINRYKQEPTDSRQRGVDYTYFVVPGEILTNVVVSGISAQGVAQEDTDPVVTPLVISDVIIDPETQLKFAYTVSGGQDGVEYTVQFTTTTQVQTSTVEEIFSINVLVENSFP